MLEIRLLGTFEVKDKKKTISIASRPAQSLFAYLILSAGTSHRREKLAGLLWPDSLEETARDNLRHALWRMRKALESGSSTHFLRADDLTIGFEKSADYRLDAAELGKVSENASADELMAVLSEYQGQLLPGFYDEWVVLEREHLYSIFEHNMARLMSLLQEEKRWLDILDWGERWIKLGQKPEPAYRALMSAHAAKGDMSKVAAIYERCVKSLKEFGVEPSEQTRALYERLKTGKEILETGPVLLKTEGRKQSLKTNLLSTRSLPGGTVTFMFTDIEGSTKLWQQFPATMPAALTRHYEILNQAITSHNGHVFQIIGDAFCAAFAIALDGLEAALEAQRALRHEAWGDIGAIRVRMALHTGSAEVHAEESTPSDYVSGITLSRAARLLSAGHGGQILLSLPTADLVREQLPDQTALRDMGTYRLKDLVQPQQIFQILAPDLPQDFPALKTLDALPNNLPLYLTSFIGRERELKDIKDWLGKTRLLTLTGAGGSGKTRLALQVAAGVIDNFEKGTWFVELAPIADASLVPNVLMNTFQLREEAGRASLDALIDFLRAKTVLLVLDNCEHLIEACARLAHELLTQCPNLKILATSREALGIAGEVIYQVPTLALPDPNHLPPLDSLTQYDAVHLFIERATAVQPNFTVTNATVPAVTQICHRLDGIPLAIELAAARIRLFSPEEIASRLDDRFRLLISGSRTATPRQQTLRGAIEWSYSLLAEPERILFRRLAVFAAGWTFEAAEAVCAGDGLDALGILDWMAQLVNKSLVLTNTQGGETRYDMLETIREYTREKLVDSGETESLRVRHASFFKKLAELTEPELRGPNQSLWSERLNTEIDNLRSALTWLLERNPDLGARLAGNLLWFWHIRCYWSEGRDWFARLLAYGGRQSLSALAKARALCSAGWLAFDEMDNDQVLALSEQGLALYRELGDKPGAAMALNLLGWAAHNLGDQSRARSLGDESLALYQELGLKWGIADVSNLLGNVTRVQGEYESASEFYKGSLACSREIGDLAGIAYSLVVQGDLAWYQGDLERAARLTEESLTLSREIGLEWNVAQSLNTLGDIARAQGSYERASLFYNECEAVWDRLGNKREMGYLIWSQGWLARLQGNYQQAAGFFAQGLMLWQEVQDKRHIAECLEGLAGVAVAVGKVERAARLFGTTEMIREATKSPLSPVERPNHDHDIAALHTRLSETDLIKLWAEGRAMTLEQAIEFALKDTEA
jgi:predicted ATPase/class 3 adenylate cyclase